MSINKYYSLLLHPYSVKEYIPGLSDESSDLLKLYDEEYNKYPFSESIIPLGDTLLDEISDERRNIWRDMLENTNINTNSKKHGQPYVVSGQTKSPLPWSLLSLLTKSLYNQILSNGRMVEHRKPPVEHYKTIVPSNNQPPAELSLSAWTNSQLASACSNQGKLLIWMIY